MSLEAMVAQMAGGMVKSVEIFCLTLLFSLPLGMLVTFGRMSKNVVLRTVIKFYISIMRGTPLMLQLMVVFFGPYYLFKVPLTTSYRFTAVIIGFVINYAAYFAEIYRGGIQSMPRGQYEAAEVLGYTRGQTFLCIVLPQVVKRVLPAVTNEVITLVKDTSLAFVLSVWEVFTVAKAIVGAQGNVMAFVVAGVFYYIFNLAVAYGMEYCERRLDYYQ
ncbi:MAG TPA: amino acid ABC transporter permease [Oscillospiraceae bacterium]|nr:amino acid ABC transporter permease [Oscillospiraceae bacterium]